MNTTAHSTTQSATPDPLWQEIFNARSVINRLLQHKSSVKMLEVGCGDRSYIRTERNAYRVGIDISAKQLERNTSLDEKILGDIQACPLPEAEFDLIVFWWVLEHLPEPEAALKNCRNALAPGGLMIIASPNIFSIKGLLTKITPHRFHQWVYRYVYKHETVGVDDHSPFKTFLKFSIATDALKQFAARNHLSIEHFVLYEDPKQWQARRNHGITGLVWNTIKSLTKVLSFGKVDAELTDFILILRKQSET